jgi:hypothetical protein
MRTLVALVFLCGPVMATAQLISSENLACTVVAAGGMACNGIGTAETEKEEKKLPKSPKLLVTHFTLQPGAALDQPSPSSDCLLVGINGGGLLNEKAPFLHVSLERDSVILMPREQLFRLRNKGTDAVEFRLIEIQR